MAFEITSDTVVKILVRRGSEYERQQVVLSEGELGYSVDTKRLYIGDGYTTGGHVAGNLNFGIVSNKELYLPEMAVGDFLYEYNVPYFLGPNNQFQQLFPVSFLEPVTLLKTIDYAPQPNNGIRISPNAVGSGLVLDYSDLGTTVNNTIQKVYSQINFDARYISLCATAGSMYIGNILNKTVNDNLNATLNVADDVFVNEHGASPYQLKLYAKDPLGTPSSLVQAASGSLLLKGRTHVSVNPGITVAEGVSAASFAFNTNNVAIRTGTGIPSLNLPNGSIYLRTDGAASTTLYVRAGGSWTALT